MILVGAVCIGVSVGYLLNDMDSIGMWLSLMLTIIVSSVVLDANNRRGYLPKNIVKRYVRVFIDMSNTKNTLILWRLVSKELDIPEENLDLILLKAYNLYSTQKKRPPIM